MVLPVGALKAASAAAAAGNAAEQQKWLSYVQQDITEVAAACHSRKAAATGKPVILKVIFETCLLSKEEIALATRLCHAAGADFVKTSTGFSKGGATAEDVGIMSATAHAVGEWCWRRMHRYCLTVAACNQLPCCCFLQQCCHFTSHFSPFLSLAFHHPCSWTGGPPCHAGEGIWRHS